MIPMKKAHNVEKEFNVNSRKMRMCNYDEMIADNQQHDHHRAQVKGCCKMPMKTILLQNFVIHELNRK